VTSALWLVAAYLFGAIPASYIAGRLSGVDLRAQGSKNLGATNVYRVLGWRYAIPVGAFDVLKGALPVATASRWAGGPDWLPVAAGIAAVAGHIFSPYVHFRGGKGVATAGGVFLALAPVALVISAGLWAAVLWLSGYVSVSSLVAVALFPLWVRLTRPDAPYTFWASVGLAVLILVLHRANIGRLIARTEHRFRTRKGAA